jgi:spore germination protein GerM
MSRRAAAILLLAMGAAVVALIYLTRSPAAASRSRRSLPFLRVTPALSGAAAPAPSGTAVPVETVRVTLFFADAAQGKLHPEERDVPKPAGPGAYLRTLFEELARGPSRPGLVGVIPPRIQLRNGFLLPNGEVVLDLAVDASLSFGSAEELSIVASLVDTALQNVANTKRVRILVNGEPVESLGGHVDLTRPLSFVRSELAS